MMSDDRKLIVELGIHGFEIHMRTGFEHVNMEVRCSLDEFVSASPEAREALSVLVYSPSEVHYRAFQSAKWRQEDLLIMKYTEYWRLVLESTARGALENAHSSGRAAREWAEIARKEFQAQRGQLRDQIVERDGEGCRLCGASEGLTVDHDIPISKGGSNELANLLLLCASCNSRKGNRPYLQVIGDE